MSSTAWVRTACETGTGPDDEETSQLGAANERELLLTETVRAALCRAGNSALRSVDIEISSGVVVLWGQVPTYYQKQLAQATVQKVDGVRGIANGLEVVCQQRDHLDGNRR
jgi:osmotically-inducible protein OsmY